MSWIIDISRQYKESEVVEVFGVLLFTDEHPNIIKILKDNDYWRAFDELSGNKWAIFSIKPKIGTYEVPEHPPGSLGYLIPIWKEPNDNKKILETFSLENTKSLPLFLLFSEIDGDIIKLTLKINDDTEQEAYKSIKNSITLITNAVNEIKKENIKNADGVYSAMSLAVDKQKNIELFKKGISIYTWIKKIIPSI